MLWPNAYSVSCWTADYGKCHLVSVSVIWCYLNKIDLTWPRPPVIFFVTVRVTNDFNELYSRTWNFYWHQNRSSLTPFTFQNKKQVPNLHVMACKLSLPVAEGNQKRGRTPSGSLQGVQLAAWVPAAPAVGYTPGYWGGPPQGLGERGVAALYRRADVLQSWATAGPPHRSSSSASGEHSHSAMGCLQQSIGQDLRSEPLDADQVGVLAIGVGMKRTLQWTKGNVLNGINKVHISHIRNAYVSM